MQIVDVYTDGGGINHGPEEERTSGWGVYVKHNNVETRLYGPTIGQATNNRGEMVAAIVALKQIAEKRIENACIVIDSQYVKDGLLKYIYGWMRRNWVKADGYPVKNVDLWKQLYESKLEADAVGPGKVQWKWVKGHSGVYGNETADRLAAKGAEQYSDYTNARTLTIMEYPTDILDDEVKAEEEKSGKKTKAAKVPEVNKFLCGSYLIAVTGKDMLYSDTMQRNVYLTTSFPKDKDRPSRFCGVPHTDSFYGVVATRNREPYLPYLHATQKSFLEDGFQIPYQINWSTVSSAATWKLLNSKEQPAHHMDKMGNVFMKLPKDDGLVDVQVTRLLDPPACAWECLSVLSDIYMTLEMLEQGVPEQVVVKDITDVFLDKYGKATDVAKKDKTVKLDVDVKGKLGKVTLTAGFSMPLFNKLSSLYKFAKELDIKLVIYNNTGNAADYAVWIRSEETVALYRNPYSAKILFLD